MITGDNRPLRRSAPTTELNGLYFDSNVLLMPRLLAPSDPRLGRPGRRRPDLPTRSRVSKWRRTMGIRVRAKRPVASRPMRKANSTRPRQADRPKEFAFCQGWCTQGSRCRGQPNPAPGWVGEVLAVGWGTSVAGRVVRCAPPAKFPASVCASRLRGCWQ
jgi:hypothetical protein